MEYLYKICLIDIDFIFKCFEDNIEIKKANKKNIYRRAD